MPRLRSRLRRVAAGLAALLLVLAAVFAWNGLNGSWRDAEHGTTAHPPRPAESTLTLAAFNLAKADFHGGGFEFASADDVRAKLDEVAAMLREHDVDVLFLSEVVYEAAPCPVNQVAYLAEAAGFHAWVYGDNYRFGWPGLRIRAGNAILSRFPLEPIAVHELTGDAPFWNPTNVRRVVLAEVVLGEERLGLASIRNDSFDLENNALQAREVLELTADRPYLLGGDFNAEPHDESIGLFAESGRFQGVFDGPATYPARGPSRRIDTILVPPDGMRVVDARVLDVDLSDHEPVIVVVESTGSPR